MPRPSERVFFEKNIIIIPIKKITIDESKDFFLPKRSVKIEKKHIPVIAPEKIRDCNVFSS